MSHAQSTTVLKASLVLPFGLFFIWRKCSYTQLATLKIKICVLLNCHLVPAHVEWFFALSLFLGGPFPLSSSLLAQGNTCDRGSMMVITTSVVLVFWAFETHTHSDAGRNGSCLLHCWAELGWAQGSCWFLCAKRGRGDVAEGNHGFNLPSPFFRV